MEKLVEFRLHVAYQIVISSAMLSVAWGWMFWDVASLTIPVYIAGIFGPAALTVPMTWETANTDTARHPHLKRIFILGAGTAVWAMFLWFYTLGQDQASMVGGYAFTIFFFTTTSLAISFAAIVAQLCSALWGFFQGKPVSA